MKDIETKTLPFEIPKLVEDDEDVEPIDRFASTDPGVAGFAYGRPNRAATQEAPRNSRPTRYERSQRAQVLGEFQEMARLAELRREQPVEPQLAVRKMGRHALDTPPDFR